MLLINFNVYRLRNSVILELRSYKYICSYSLAQMLMKILIFFTPLSRFSCLDYFMSIILHYLKLSIKDHQIAWILFTKGWLVFLFFFAWRHPAIRACFNLSQGNEHIKVLASAGRTKESLLAYSIIETGIGRILHYEIW